MLSKETERVFVDNNSILVLFFLFLYKIRLWSKVSKYTVQQVYFIIITFSGVMVRESALSVEGLWFKP